MNQLITHKLYLKSTIYLLLIAQLCATTLPYCSWVMGFDSEMIEMAEVEDTETEKEGDADEKEKKLESNSNFLFYNLADLCRNSLDTYEIETIHHLEVTTPPPRYSSVC